MPPKAAAGAKKKAAGRKPKNAHQLSTQLPEGTILNDYTKGQWKLGKPIGSGGFGLIYLASKSSSPVGPNAEYVIKVEPHSNGPLFCELHFYQRVAKSDLIKQWMGCKKLKSLGMPKFIAHGAHEDRKEKFRFMVMERFGTDLQKLFEENGKFFPRKTVITLGISLIEVLQYIHSREYCHADIKASNLLLGFKNTNEVYLVDYGLAYRYLTDGNHKPHKPDPKWKHNGTIEFTSRDAHNGLTPSRRGDMEILCYCLVQWLCGKLPWEDKLADCNYVQQQKNKYMDDIPGFFKKCFPTGDKPEELEKLLNYVVDLEYDEEPDYNFCTQILRTGLRKCGFADDGKLAFTGKGSGAVASKSKTPRAKTPAAKGRKQVLLEENSEDSDGNRSPMKKKTQSPTPSPALLKSPVSKVKSPTSNRKQTPRAQPKQTSKARPKSAAKGTPATKVSSPALARAVGKQAAAKADGVSAVVGNSSKPVHNRKRKLVAQASVACQTSPGLKGLKRSRRK